MGHQLDPALISGLKAKLEAGLEAAVLAVRAAAGAEEAGPVYARARADLVDDVVAALGDAAGCSVVDELGPEEASVALSVAVVALGGYGRRELCPASDIDLLFLLPEGGADPAIGALVDKVLYGLWDLGLEVGQASRTIEQCMEVAQHDQMAKTSLVDAREIVFGDESGRRRRRLRFDDFSARVDRDLLAGRGAQIFIKEKLDEAARRGDRFGNTVYRLEPDVKSGQGGLRELHTALWVARARWRSRSLLDLVRIGVVSSREGRSLQRAYDFLLGVRTELHLASGRRRESLGFEYQEAIARTLGYMGAAAAEKRHGTERFMRAYYFHARHCRRICQLIVERATSHPARRPRSAHPAPGGFKTFGGMLTVSERTQFADDPAAIMRIFRVAQEHSYELYSYTKDLVLSSLHLINRDARRNPKMVADFLAVFESAKTNGAIVELMHDLGVLRRFVPEFARVTARWQHSLYHEYTVDVHSVFVVKQIKRLRAGAVDLHHTELVRRAAELPRPSVLFMAGFLHDIGKGWRGGDHALRGEKVALTVGARFEQAGLPMWSAEETGDLAWLVREHLAMSNISQRRDLDDPELIAGFAEQVGSLERLTMLWILTVADMMATSPKVWNSWKEALLFELYDKTRLVLEGTSDADGYTRNLAARRRRLVEQIMVDATAASRRPPSRALVDDFVSAMPDRYLLAVKGTPIVDHLEAWREVSERGGVSMKLVHHKRDQVTELTIVCPDHPGLLALIAGTVSANHLQILAAQIFSFDSMFAGGGTDRVAVDVLHLADATGGLCEDPERWAGLRRDLPRVLTGQLPMSELVEKRLRQSTLSERHRPHVETKVVWARDDSRRDNVLDVYGPDTLGALYIIAKALSAQGLTIKLAKISTQGDRIADGFYLADARTGGKINDEARLTSIADAVRNAMLAADALA